MTAITVNFNSVIDISDEQFFQLCVKNSDIKFERKANGEIIVMPPRNVCFIVLQSKTVDAIASCGGETGRRNSDLVIQLGIWNRQTKLGQVFDSSTGYTLPNKANRSPDVSWIKQERWDSLTPQQREKFIPLAPDFALELMSPSDSLVNVRAKMREYRSNGVELGWLINPEAKEVEIYRSKQDVKLLNSPRSLSGEDILPGFILDLTDIF